MHIYNVNCCLLTNDDDDDDVHGLISPSIESLFPGPSATLVALRAPLRERYFIPFLLLLIFIWWLQAAHQQLWRRRAVCYYNGYRVKMGHILVQNLTKSKVDFVWTESFIRIVCSSRRWLTSEKEKGLLLLRVSQVFYFLLLVFSSASAFDPL